METWHFTAAKHTLRDGTKFKLGKSLPKIAGEIVPCRNGYHGSPSVLDALGYAMGPHLYRRELSGVIVPHGDPIDKYAASEAKAIAYCNIEPLLWVFGRQCALDVIHLWEAPEVVREYLVTGNEDIRAAARDAAWDAAWAAAWAAARAAAWAAARAAARDAARAAARDAARDAALAAARDAAWAAALAAAGDAALAAARAAALAAARDPQRARLDAWVIAYMETGILPTVKAPEVSA